jgi:hypothetical protein
MLDLAIGRRELGKTTLAIHLARHSDTRVFFDPRHMINTTSDILTDSNVREALYTMLDTRSEIVVRPQFDVEGTFFAMCEEIYNWLIENPGQTFCLLVDESRFVKNPEENIYFDYIVRCTPSKFVTVIFTAHSIPDIGIHLRRIADYIILFQMTEDADLEFVRERCGRDVEKEVQTLRPYEFIVWNDSTRKWKKVTKSQSWYVKLEERTAA